MFCLEIWLTINGNVSCELFDIFVDFFTELVKIAPTVATLGNHDTTLNNTSRLDVLSPIIKAINNPNLILYKHSGIYSFNDLVDFYVFGCLDGEDKWPIEVKNKNKINIGLYHGMINGCILQNGQTVECPYELNKFLNITDYLMCGDIHAQQYLNPEKTAAYPGSLLQQNYGESLEKGYLLWNIEEKKKHTVNFVKLPNLYPFYSIYLDNSLQIPTNLKFQKKARIRLVSRSLTSAEKKKLSEDVQYFYEPTEIDYLELDKQEKQVSIFDDKKIENLDDLVIQESLIRDFLKPLNLKDEVIEEVLKLNKKYDIKSDEENLRNVQYEIGKMSFSNLFSYGEDNVFDFSKHRGILGVFGRNGTRKIISCRRHS